MKDLKNRMIYGILGIILTFAVIYYGTFWFLIFIMLVTGISIKEFLNLFNSKGLKTSLYLPIIFSLTIELIVYIALPESRSNEIHQPALIFILIFSPILYFFLLVLRILFLQKDNALSVFAASISSILYITLPMLSLLIIRLAGDYYPLIHSFNFFHYNILLALLITIWVCDSMAFFVGSAIGKHKLFPSVSPKKSWEGAIAGFVFSIPAFAVFTHFFLPEFPLIHSLILGALIGITGQIGDLFESKLKRDAGVKDSSHLIPGHGGLLDRLDSLFFTSPLMLMYLIIISV